MITLELKTNTELIWKPINFQINGWSIWRVLDVVVLSLVPIGFSHQQNVVMEQPWKIFSQLQMIGTTILITTQKQSTFQTEKSFIQDRFWNFQNLLRSGRTARGWVETNWVFQNRNKNITQLQRTITFVFFTIATICPLSMACSKLILLAYLKVLYSDITITSLLRNILGPVTKPRRCHIAGWGHMLNSKPSAILQEKHVFIAKDAVCESHLPQMKSMDDVLCTTQGACDGDFGGPLICVEGDEPVLRGIASFSPDCFKKPTVWTDVHGYLDWIADSTRVRRSLIGWRIKTHYFRHKLSKMLTQDQQLFQQQLTSRLLLLLVMDSFQVMQFVKGQLMVKESSEEH